MRRRNSNNPEQNATILGRSPRCICNNYPIQDNPVNVLRRSSRILQKKLNESDDSIFSTPTPSSAKASEPGNSQTRKVLKELNNLGSEEFVKRDKPYRKSEQLKVGGEEFRRSLRLCGKENVNLGVAVSNSALDEFNREDDDLCNKALQVRRKTTRKTNCEMADNGTSLGRLDCTSKKCLGGVSDKKTVEVVAELPKVQYAAKPKKADKLNQGTARKPANLDIGVSSSVKREAKCGLGSSEQLTVGSPCRALLEGELKMEERAVEKRQKRTGVKRKCNQAEGSCPNDGLMSGWTKDQEAALQRAYASAKPSPHFWKKVAKMVPGKSVQDCFDRIHAEQLTPCQPKTRSRAKPVNSSPVVFSASKLLDSNKPKSKRPKSTQQKSCRIKKTVKQLLEMHCQVDRNQNADLFSLLEPNTSPSTDALQKEVNSSTPTKQKPTLLRRCEELSSSAHKKQCSRFSNLDDANVTSPQVLKPIKNKALHERYIKQLQAREAKRRAVSTRASKSSLQKECRVQKNAVESAKTALLLDANDSIKQFQQAQANGLSTSTDVDDDHLYTDEGVDECGAEIPLNYNRRPKTEDLIRKISEGY